MCSDGNKCIFLCNSFARQFKCCCFSHDYFHTDCEYYATKKQWFFFQKRVVNKGITITDCQMPLCVKGSRQLVSASSNAVVEDLKLTGILKNTSTNGASASEYSRASISHFLVLYLHRTVCEKALTCCTKIFNRCSSGVRSDDCEGLSIYFTSFSY